ncbi:hypothetical protein AXF42_Ash018495 [Apostasia shenzhenica]|uniref:tRNA-uridine aminocarboxypropyltransferase n=1 Tax=Apostasia shenzhenica TaxID=1088818 RepID=A0A2H9ZZG0_9ASPA|nr:hypothetical protein AXF42_Ash018495 [Apostasia shenzhenica]
MGSEGHGRRPFCRRCSKPSRLCLCARLNSPPLDNSVSVTILQHSLEKTHPLNSARVAILGLKNLSLVPVTDVNFQARFLIHPLQLDRDDSSSPIVGNTADFGNYAVTYSSKNILVAVERASKPDIGWILNYPVGRSAASNGFMVAKVQRKSEELKDFEEFKLVVPPGSVLLFPSGNAIDLAEVNFEVKNLIVLDGTWAKARRMYYENPWLKLLPHLKLDPAKKSLYKEVRHQPKAGFLSTIESIVYAMKELGNVMEGLDDLLEVFESMIGDQRRCKDEKFRALGKS